MQQYQYEKLNTDLDEIRLIRLMPGSLQDDIQFRIFHAPLVPPIIKNSNKRISIQELQKTLPPGWVVQNTFHNRYLFISLGKKGIPNSWCHPDPNFDHSLYELQEVRDSVEYTTKYEALSYTWGDQSDPVEAHVQDSRLPSPCLVTVGIGVNLASALKHLPYPDKPRILWVNALCINQQDTSERNAQVRCMKNVYMFASAVVVWLGEAADNSGHAFCTMQCLDKQVEVTQETFIGDAPGAQEPRWWDPVFPLPYGDTTWASLLAVFRRPWFNRVWVVQEVHLGGKHTVVQCGLSCVPWGTLRKAVVILLHKEKKLQELHTVLRDIQPGITHINPSNFPRILQTVWRRQCTDPRDKIYGVLSLTSESIASRIQPDYQLLAHEIYKDAMLTDINVKNRVDMLQYCVLADRSPEGPSWVPNWAIPPSTPLTSINLVGKRAVAGFSSSFIKYDPPNVLEVLGKECAKVSGVSSPASQTIKKNTYILQEVEHDGIEGRIYVTGELFPDAFLEVLVRGAIRERYPGTVILPSIATLRKQYQAAVSPSEEQNNTLEPYRLEMRNLSFISTNEGYIGVALSEAQPGDCVCVILGLDAPMLLRPTTAGQYLVVGPCFVHGLMDGEGILGPLPRLSTKTTLEL